MYMHYYTVTGTSLFHTQDMEDHDEMIAVLDQDIVEIDQQMACTTDIAQLLELLRNRSEKQDEKSKKQDEKIAQLSAGNFLLTEVKYVWLVIGLMQNSKVSVCMSLLYYILQPPGRGKGMNRMMVFAVKLKRSK